MKSKYKPNLKPVDELGRTFKKRLTDNLGEQLKDSSVAPKRLTIK